MHSPWLASGLALFIWWFSTGAILWGIRRSERGRPGAGQALALLSLPVLVLGLLLYHRTLDRADLPAVYGGFIAAVAIWGWAEISFLTGAITGPNLRPCPPGLPEWERFIRAWGTVAYHEMLLTALLILLWLQAVGAPNHVGLWTFAVLYGARISAKLNLYFGVPRINLEFLPGALSHLASHFRIARLNWLFPLSITALTFATACWIERLLAAGDPAAVAGFALLAAITALALLEHWLMVLPLPDAKLWRWMLPAPKPTMKPEGSEEPHGL